MQYAGGKKRQAKVIAEYIDHHLLPSQDYLEPFCGAFSVGERVWTNGTRYASDIDPHIVACLKAVSEGWEPPGEVSEEEYYHILDNPEEYSDYLYGFVAFGCSFGGKKADSYAKGGTSNYALTARNALLSMNLESVRFSVRSYEEWEPEGMFIFADPPYTNTSSVYEGSYIFNPYDFWDTMREWANCNHVIVSERFAPKRGTELILSWQRTSTLSNKTKLIGENLYRVLPFK